MSDVTTEAQAQSLALADELAAALNEPQTLLLRRVIDVIGVERTQAHLVATLAIEAQGGELTKNQKRRRTPGGVFFHLVRYACSSVERKQIFPKVKAKKATRPAPGVNAPTWAAVEAALNELQKGQKGTTSVKVTLIGRPVRTAQIGDSMLCQMEAAPPGESMPKGLPTPPANATAQSYAVFIALPAWKKVQAALQDKDDALIIEGWPYMDQQRGLFIVLAKSVTTKNQQRAKRVAAQAPK